jgi:acyl carrier protein
VSKTKKLEKTETSKATAGKAAAATTKQTASPASPAEAVSAFTGPWICGLGHPDGQDSQTSTANQRVSIESASEAPETQSTECEVEMGAPAASSHGSKAKLSNPQPTKLSPTAHAGVTVPTQMVASVYTIRKVLKSEVAGLAVFGNTNSVVLADASAVMTEHKEHSQGMYALAAPRMASTSDRYSPLGAVKSAPVSSPQVRRLLIRELLNASDESRMTCNEVSLQKGIRPKSLARRPNDFEHLRQTCNEGSSTMQDTWASQTTLSQPQNDGLAINQPTAHLTAALTEGRLQRSRVSTDIRRVFEQQAMKQLVQSPVQNPQTGFFELGLKSGDLMELSTKLSDALDRPIQVSTLFDYPTMDALLEHFRGVVGEKKMSYALQQTNVVPAAPVVASASCVLPGGVSSPQQLGSTLSQGHHGAICRVPPERWSLAEWWDPDPAASNKMYTQHGGFLGAGVVQSFDAVFFGFSKTEARTMSPSQRLVLEHAVQVLCGTNQSIAGLRGQKIGVFVGSCHHDWEHLECNKNSSSPYTTTGIAASVLAG